MISGKFTVNFYWRGSDFQFLYRLCLLSHIYQGHDCIVWLSGPPPKNEFWIDDLEKLGLVTIFDASEVFSTDDFKALGAHDMNTSDLWRMYFLYKLGGFYCDMDAVALRPWDDVMKSGWFVCSENNYHYSNGILGCPPGQSFLMEAANIVTLDNAGTVKKFTRVCQRHGIEFTHDTNLFYPYRTREIIVGKDLVYLTKTRIPDYAYSIHLFLNVLRMHYRYPYGIDRVVDSKGSVLHQLFSKISRDLPMVNESRTLGGIND